MNQVSFNFIVYFQRYAPDKLNTAKMKKKESNSVNTVDRIMVLALCTSANGPLSLYQVSFNCLVQFQRYAPDKLYIAKMNKSVIMALNRSPNFKSSNKKPTTAELFGT